MVNIPFKTMSYLYGRTWLNEASLLEYSDVLSKRPLTADIEANA
jgi:hypothetical protein